jgi:hypothetical protein
MKRATVRDGRRRRSSAREAARRAPRPRRAKVDPRHLRQASHRDLLPDWIGSHGRALAWFGGVPAQRTTSKPASARPAALALLSSAGDRRARLPRRGPLLGTLRSGRARPRRPRFSTKESVNSLKASAPRRPQHPAVPHPAAGRGAAPCRRDRGRRLARRGSGAPPAPGSRSVGLRLPTRQAPHEPTLSGGNPGDRIPRNRRSDAVGLTQQDAIDDETTHRELEGG